MAVTLEQLYALYELLTNAKEKVDQHSKEYEDCIEGIKGNESEKMLTAQIISKFFKHFPTLQDKALNALLDLCEDEEAKIRCCAMRYLVHVGKDVKEHIPKITDILAQLMQLDEGNIAILCISQLWKEDQLSVLKTLYNHISTLNNNVEAREKCLSFMHKKLLRWNEAQPAEIEAITVEETKKILQVQEDLSSEEILLLINYLSSVKWGKTQQGQQELLDFLAEIMELERDFDPLEDGVTDRVILCTSNALKFFSAKLESTKFVAYYCDQILPNLESAPSLSKPHQKLQILKQLAELSISCGKFENPSLHVVQIFDKLKLYMPVPPEDADLQKMPNLEFSFVECLLFAFHRLARQCPDFLTHDAQVLKDFRARLVYFSRGVQGCKKAFASKTHDALDKAAVIHKKIAPVLLSNIDTLIKDLFYQPPMYKCNVTLSFKQELKQVKDTRKPSESSSSAASKRHVPITFDNGSGHAKQGRGNRPGENMKLYSPPSGKFSNNFQNSYDRGGSRTRSRGRGPRGRGGRSWRN